MRHRVAGRQLSRNTSHRAALRMNMAHALFEHGAIRTTEAKAKELRPFVEKLITLAKKGTLAARRLILSKMRDRDIYTLNEAKTDTELADKTVVQKLFDEIAPRYATRPGGYTRIIRLAERRIGDAGKQVILQLVEETRADADAKGTTSRRRRRTAKRREAIDSAADAQAQAEKPADAGGEAQA